MTASHPLSNPKLALILAYAPTGLGHLRVTDALRHGLPQDAQPILLPAHGRTLTFLHRMTSIHPLFQAIFEWSQQGQQQQVLTEFYRKIFLRDAQKLEEQLLEILKQRVELPETLLVVASHFGIAHQVGAIKHRLEQRAKMKVILVVQVTDDTPQSIWYIPGADLICVPSESTKMALEEYGKHQRYAAVPFQVIPYPISPHLGESLSVADQKNRKYQMDAESNTPLHIVVPISGAAVGTSFLSTLMKELHKKLSRAHFHVVVKHTMFTQMFIDALEKRPYIQLYTSHSDRQVIELYETVYAQNVAGIEITKPSEQAFKVLLCSQQRGGSVLLFTEPIGKQEHDNLAFARRHRLIPTQEEQQLLFDLAAKKHTLTSDEQTQLFPTAKTWRGLCLPKDAKLAVNITLWYHHHLFSLMRECYTCSPKDEGCKQEIGDDGVIRFWKQVGKLI